MIVYWYDRFNNLIISNIESSVAINNQNILNMFKKTERYVQLSITLNIKINV